MRENSERSEESEVDEGEESEESEVKCDREDSGAMRAVRVAAQLTALRTEGRSIVIQ